MQSLTPRIALITGANKGIGLEIARQWQSNRIPYMGVWNQSKPQNKLRRQRGHDHPDLEGLGNRYSDVDKLQST
jgi:NAD(P)-dependent dehydrogenase (short-subunit alcohol dehydrogenase family)